MHSKHRLGGANTNTYSYINWQNLLRSAHGQPVANPKLSNASWHLKAVTLKEQINILKYRTDTLYNEKHAQRFSGQHGPAYCPLCGNQDSTSHSLLRCTHPQINRMCIDRHHHAVSLCFQEISKCDSGLFIMGIDASNREDL